LKQEFFFSNLKMNGTTTNNNNTGSSNSSTTSNDNSSPGLPSLFGGNNDVNTTTNNNNIDDDDDDDDDVINATKTTATSTISQQQNYMESGLPDFLHETQQSKRKRAPDTPKQKRQRYTKEFKANVLSAFLNTPGAKLPHVAKQFNIPEGTLRGFYDNYRRRRNTGIETSNKVAINTANNDTATATAATSTGGDDNGDDDDDDDDGDDNSAIVAAAARKRDATDDNDQATTTPKKKRRQRYSNETKIQVILALETRPDTSLNEIAKEFDIAAGTIRGWREEADKIQKQAMENRRVGAKANPSKDPLKRIWDAILRLFELNSRLPATHQKLEFNVAVVKKMGLAARDLLIEEYKVDPSLLTQTEYFNMERFKASETWARKWYVFIVSIGVVLPPTPTPTDLIQLRFHYTSNFVLFLQN
jgi:transposase-like protein